MAGDYFTGRTCLITGAGGGIGRALAVQLAQRGARLVLWDSDTEALAGTVDAVGWAPGVPVSDASAAVLRADVVDVTDHAAVAEAARAVGDDVGPGGVDLVVCLAGVIHTGSVLASAAADVERVVAVNLLGTMSSVSALLPLVVASGRGHVVTTSSAFGMVTVPRYAAYCASKAAVRAYTDVLRLEIESAGLPVRVSCALPGGVATGIVREGGFADGEDAAAVVARFEDRIARTSPEEAARVILRGIERGRRQILVGPDARAVAAVTRLTGNAYQRLLPRLMRRHTRPGRS